MLSGIKKKKKRNSGLKIKSLWKKSKESYSIHCSLFITALFHVFDGSFDSFDSFAKFVFGSCVGQTDAIVVAESAAHNQCHVCIVKDVHAENADAGEKRGCGGKNGGLMKKILLYRRYKMYRMQCNENEANGTCD